MRHTLIKTSDFHKLLVCTPVNSVARKVISRGTAYDPAPPQEPEPIQAKPTVSYANLLLFRRLFGKQRRNHGNRIVIRRAS